MALPRQADIALAVFVKTPNLSPVKTRLAKDIGRDAALSFYELSWRAVASVMMQAQGLGFHPYWAVAEASGLTAWTDFTAIWQGEGDLGDRLATVYRCLFAKHQAVCLIGADCPQIHVGLFQKAVVSLETNEFVIGRAADGGFYLFAGRVDIPTSVWTGVRYSSEATAAELETALQPYGKVGALEILSDVDQEQDLTVIEQCMQSLQVSGEPGLSGAQRNLLHWLTKRGGQE